MIDASKIFIDKSTTGQLIVLRECRVCRQKKNVCTDYYKDSSVKSGIKATCKECLDPKNKDRLNLYREFKKAYRVCGDCRETLPLTNMYFYRSKKSHMGLKNTCKICDLNDAKKRAQIKLKQRFLNGDTRIETCECGDYFNNEIYGPTKNFRKLCVPCDRRLNPPIARPPRNKRRLVA